MQQTKRTKRCHFGFRTDEPTVELSWSQPSGWPMLMIFSANIANTILHYILLLDFFTHERSEKKTWSRRTSASNWSSEMATLLLQLHQPALAREESLNVLCLFIDRKEHMKTTKFRKGKTVRLTLDTVIIIDVVFSRNIKRIPKSTPSDVRNNWDPEQRHTPICWLGNIDHNTPKSKRSIEYGD